MKTEVNKTPSYCAYIQAQFPLFAEDEIGRIAAWRVGRHLAHCVICTQVAAEDRRLTTLLRQADVVPPGQCGYLPSQQPEVSRVRRNRLGIGGALAATGLALIGIAGFVVLAPGQPGNPSAALAQVEQAMRQVRTQHWVETDTIYAPQSEARNHHYEKWIRLDPPTELIRMQDAGPNVKRNLTEMLFTPNDRRWYVQSNNYIEVSTWRPELPSAIRREAFRHSLSTVTLVPYSAGQRGQSRQNFQSGNSESSWTTRNGNLEGKPVLEMICRTVIHYKQDSQQHPEENMCHLWADPKTDRLVRFESRTADAMTGTLLRETTRTDFRYDEPLPDRLFVLSAPLGTPVFHAEDQEKVIAPSSLTADERKTVEQIIARSETAWQKTDWKAFSAVWDFAYAASLPNSRLPVGSLERQLRRQMNDERGLWSLIRSRVEGINSISYVRLPKFGDIDQPPGAPPLVRVQALSNRGYKDGDDSGGIELYTLRRDGAHGFRIVGWQSEDRKLREWHDEWRQQHGGRR